MFSIQMLTRNFRRAIPIRRFGSTSVVPEKVNTKLTTTKDAKAVEKPTSTSQSKSNKQMQFLKKQNTYAILTKNFVFVL